jgi:hypothetical protein
LWYGRSMSEEADTALRYRQNAEELRVIAEGERDPNTKDALLGIATDYERMAATLEAIDRTNKAMKRRSPQ